ncbi:MAG: glycosyltransferase family 4 protein [Pseudomonadota bacterium]
MTPVPSPDQIDVIAPNFKRRHSGVTSTVVRLVPLQAKTIGIVASGPDLPPEVPNLPPARLVTLPRNGPSGARVWHARRNVEMLAGVLLKNLTRKRFKLLFTSAAQRRHSGYTRWLIRQMDAIIATSARSAAFLDRAATVIHHGVDCQAFAPASDRSALRRRLGLPEDGVLVGCFGRIRPQKGNDLFVETMLRVLETNPQSRALMMGRATEDHSSFLQNLKDKVEEAGQSDRIFFRDEVPFEDLAAHFQALDLYVAPQRWEGFGLTPLEAMACGAPVIATRVGAFEELVVDGVTGHLVDIEDVDEMVRTLSALVSDDAQREVFGTAARAHVVARFSIETEVKAINALYRDLLNRA